MQTQSDILNFRKDLKVRQIVAVLSKNSPWRQAWSLALDWLVIGVCIITAQTYFNGATYFLAVIVIAGRQHAMLVMMHEAAHMRFSKKLSLNNWLGNIFAAYPILMTTELYRSTHAAHHSFLNSEKDPDWSRKIVFPEWNYPMTSVAVARVFAQQLAIGGYEWVVPMFQMSKNDGKKWLYYATLGVLMMVMHWEVSFLMYWFVPLFFVFPLLQRIRSVAEHFGLDRSHEFNNARNVLSGAVESFLFGPHNIKYHLVHHLFPTVPHYNLKKLHNELSAIPVYAEFAHNNDSYFISGRSVWKDLIASSEIQKKKMAA